MEENKPVGGSVFVNADTGETIVTPYTKAQIDEMKKLMNLSEEEVAKLAALGLTEEEIASL
jgi:hypothetical protein